MEDSTETFTQSHICNHSNEIKILKYLLLIFVLFFIIFAIWSHYERLDMRVHYENLLKELNGREEYYNIHIDNTVIYLENIVDLLKKLRFPSFNRPPIIYNHVL
jgi:hypothetical protein